MKTEAVPHAGDVPTRTPASPEVAAGGSPALYDPGEEHWPNKVHLGCGGIYLLGYINIDIAQDAVPAQPDPACPSENAAYVWDYYGGLTGDYAHLPQRRGTVADRIGDFQRMYRVWGFQLESVRKVVCIQMFEHLSPVGGYKLLSALRRLMAPGAPLILSVPDMEGTLAWLEEGTEAQRRFAVRHLYGSRRDRYNHHKAWYTAETLSELLDDCGFSACASLPNFHLYPALVMKAIRP